jgi:hypothetical protein
MTAPGCVHVRSVRMMQITDAEWRDFVMTGTRISRLAVTRSDGRPH